MVYKNYMYYWHMINITFSWNENAMYRFFKMVTFIFILFNTECKEPNFGENCGQICKCGQGMDRCDPETGCVCKPGWTGRIVLSISMSVTMKPYVEMKRSAKTLKGLTCASVESVLKWMEIFAKVIYIIRLFITISL